MPSNSLKCFAYRSLNASGVFFIAFILLKPLYLLPSGSFQLGDLCIVLSFLFMIVEERLGFRIDRIDYPFFGFVGLACVVNLVYYAQTQSLSFLQYTSFYIFNCLTVLLFRRISPDSRLMQIAVWAFRVALLLQVVFYFVGLGRSYGSIRYRGTFNDPNQMGFYVFSAYLFILIANKKLNLKNRIADDACSIFLLFQTASTAMMLGLLVLILTRIIIYVTYGGGEHKALAAIASVLLVIMLGFFIVPNSGLERVSTGVSQVDNVVNRVIYKANKFSWETDATSYNSSILIDRGIDKIIYYPEKVLYGAGEGDFARFERAYAPNELHSTILGLLFYYGAFPFMVLVYWIYANFRRGASSPQINLLYLPLLAECFFLANQRQPILWMLIILASINTESAKQ